MLTIHSASNYKFYGSSLFKLHQLLLGSSAHLSDHLTLTLKSALLTGQKTSTFYWFNHQLKLPHSIIRGNQYSWGFPPCHPQVWYSTTVLTFWSSGCQNFHTLPSSPLGLMTDKRWCFESLLVKSTWSTLGSLPLCRKTNWRKRLNIVIVVCNAV